MASDSAATFGSGALQTIGQQECQKVIQLGKAVLYSATGAVGIAQLISERVKESWSPAKAFSGMSPYNVMDRIAKTINELVAPYLKTGESVHNMTGAASDSLCKSLIAYPVDDKPQLVQFGFNGAPESATSHLPFVALGSGQAIADPFLAFLKRLLWGDRAPTLAEGRLVATWTIDHVRGTNPGGVGGKIQLGVVEKTDQGWSARMLADDDVNEHLQRIASAEHALVREVRGELVAGTAAAPLPKPPDTTAAGAAPDPAPEAAAPIS